MAFTFDYFSPSDASQYAFFRIPKMLITDSRFRCISMEAKLLYGILLDRVSLSVDHGWVDEKNHVYIIYTIEQVMSDMNCSNRKAIGLLKELKESLGIEAKIHDTPYRKDTILGILDLLTDICCTKKKVLYICGEARPASIVKSRLMKLNSGHLEYVLKCLDENKTQVKNIRQYMLAILYNAPTTIGPFHRAWANHDMDSGRYYQGGDNDNE